MSRRAQRHRADLPAAFTSRPEGEKEAARVADVSDGGLLLERIPRPVVRDEAVWVEIPRERGRGRVGILGRVAWVERDRAGIAIEAMLPHHRERLALLLRRLRGGRP